MEPLKKREMVETILPFWQYLMLSHQLTISGKMIYKKFFKMEINKSQIIIIGSAIQLLENLGMEFDQQILMQINVLRQVMEK